MGREKSAVTLVLGVLLLLLVHYSLQSGSITLRWTTQQTTSADPNFWFYAGSFYGLGLILVVSGVIHLTIGRRYLPRIETEDRLWSLVYTGLILLVVGAFGFVLKDILPGVYL